MHIFKKLSGVIFAVLCLSACGWQVDDEEDEIPTASLQIETGLTLSDEQEYTYTKESETQHYYELPLSSDKQYVIDVVNSPASGTNLFVQVVRLDDETEQPFTDQRVITEGNIETIDLIAEGGSTYLKVWWSNPEVVLFTIEVNPSTDEGLEQSEATYEPNNSLFSAYPISKETSYFSTLLESDHYDYYRLEMAEGESIEIETINNKSDMESTYWIQLFDSQEVPLTIPLAVAPGETEAFEYEADESQQIFIRFQSLILGDDQNYTFSVK